MRIGIPKEIKCKEGRVAQTPTAVRQLIESGHEVIVEHCAGVVSGFYDSDYVNVGAIIGNQSDVWNCELVVKVKEPLEQEFKFFRSDLIIFGYMHLAANPTLVEALRVSGVRAIALENIEMEGRLPGLDPMSKIAGRLAGQLAVQYLYSINNGSGLLLGGVDGTDPGKAVVIGGGVSGLSAAHELVRLGVNVVVFDIDDKKVATINICYSSKGIIAKRSTPENIAKELVGADVLIGAVLVPGRPSPIVATRDMIKQMIPGSVVVDIAIDQGGCFETTELTNWENPTRMVDGITHIAIPNMPGAVPRTSSVALSDVIFPQALKIANGELDDMVQKATSVCQYVVTDERLK